MKRIGLIGGVGWPSTALYYRAINQGARARRGGLATAPMLIDSLDFGEIEPLIVAGEWARLEAVLLDASRRLAAGGAELIALACNALHEAAAPLERDAGVPFVHIADAAGAALRRDGRKRIALLGTPTVMASEAYAKRVLARGDLQRAPLRPQDESLVERAIYDELLQGRVSPALREAFDSLFATLRDRGCDAVLLACTELSLLTDGDEPVSDSPCGLPLYDTAATHVDAILEHALGD